MFRRVTFLACLGLAACAGPPGGSLSGDPGGIAADEDDAAGEAESALSTPSEQNAVRFLEQATFGPRLAAGESPPPIDSVEGVVAAGIPQSITSQIAAPSVAFDGGKTSQSLESQFFVRAVNGKDQLRQRVAFALSQIVVMSRYGVPTPNNGVCTGANKPEHCQSKQAMAGYLNLLRSKAFGNYRDILLQISMDPGMGRYLDMVDNKAYAPDAKPVVANENYARELLQLFSLGVHKLKDNGTPWLDCPDAQGHYDGVADSPCTPQDGGRPIPAYTESHVRAFAQTLTGWTFAKVGGTGNPQDDCPAMGWNNPVNYMQPMLPCAANHDKSQQTLLRGEKTTANAGPYGHLVEAIDNIFGDPNLPPFVSKQLIQHLVTSNPSPAYVARVVAKFKDDGSGVRGNLAAVVRAILQDVEARGAAPPVDQTAKFGHLRSPVLRLTSLVRWLDGHLDTSGGKDPGAKMSTWSDGMGQEVMRPPSVFSFYSPFAPLPGSETLLGPEFELLGAATATRSINITYAMLFYPVANSGILLNLDVMPAAADDIVEWVGRYLLHGAISSDLQLEISQALQNPWANTTERRRKLAVMLATLSPEFAIQR